MTDRRSFLGMAAASAVVPAAAAPAGGKWRRAVIVDALGDLGNPNPPRAGEGNAIQRGVRRRRTLDARTLADAHASGIAAINCTLGYVAGPGDPWQVTISDIANQEQLIRAYPRDLLKVVTAADILRAKREGRIGLISGFQNMVMIGDDLERIDMVADLGVRVCQLTYNPANALGDGAIAPGNRGLTEWGRKVVERLNANRLMVDLSHSGENTCLDAARLSKQPISINHTGCRALVDVPRNKSDAELRLVADKGGFVGIYFMPFLDKASRVTADDVVAHIEHAVRVCGEDHVGIGTDGTITQIDDLEAFRTELAKEIAERRKLGISAPGEGPDTLPFAIDLRGKTQYFDLADRLERRGHKAARIEKILGMNFVRYAHDVWGS